MELLKTQGKGLYKKHEKVQTVRTRKKTFPENITDVTPLLAVLVYFIEDSRCIS